MEIMSPWQLVCSIQKQREIYMQERSRQTGKGLSPENIGVEGQACQSWENSGLVLWPGRTEQAARQLRISVPP